MCVLGRRRSGGVCGVCGDDSAAICVVLGLWNVECVLGHWSLWRERVCVFLCAPICGPVSVFGSECVLLKKLLCSSCIG